MRSSDMSESFQKGDAARHCWQICRHVPGWNLSNASVTHRIISSGASHLVVGSGPRRGGRNLAGFIDWAPLNMVSPSDLCESHA
jgi:hypothetical protein